MKQKIKNKLIINPFSLVELFVAMVVLLIIMLCMVTLLSSTQGVFSASIDNDSIYSNTRVAFDLITRDLQSSLYEEDKIFFWQEDTDKINFIAVAESSKICDIRYKLEANNIQRYAVDSDVHGWVFYGNKSINAWPSPTPPEVFHDIMPYVTNLTFTCFYKSGIKIDPDENNLTPYPYSVKIDITTLGRRSFLKWEELKKSGDTDYSNSFRDNNTRTFSKTVYLGDRY